MCGHSHDRTCSVAGKYVVGYIDRYLGVRERIDGIRAGEHACNLAVGYTLTLGTVFDPCQVLLDLGTLLVGSQAPDILALRRQHHERHAEHGVGTRGEDGDGSVLPLDVELHLRTFGAAYPVTLRIFERVGPIQAVESLQQTRSVGAHAQTPLAHHTLLNGITSANRQSLADLVVGEHRTEFGAPVDLGIRQIGYTVLHQALLLLTLGECCPGRVLALKTCNEFGDRFGFLCDIVVVMVEHLNECPLRPVVELRIAGLDRTAPIVAETYLTELADISLDVLARCYFGVLTGLNSILLRRQAIGVEAHGVQHVEAALAFVAAVDIRGNIAQRMAYVQTGTRRIREHVQHIVVRFVRLITYSIGIGIVPRLLPFLLNVAKVVFHIIVYDLENFDVLCLPAFGFVEPIKRTKLQFFSDICKLLSEIITYLLKLCIELQFAVEYGSCSTRVNDRKTITPDNGSRMDRYRTDNGPITG